MSSLSSPKFDKISKSDQSKIMSYEQYDEIGFVCFVDQLLKGSQYGNDLNDSHIELVDKLFSEGKLKHDMISDNTFIELMEGHFSHPYNIKLWDIFLKHVPKSRWISMRSNENGTAITGSTILHAVIGMGNCEHVIKYTKIFLDLGVDPKIKNELHTILSRYVRLAIPELIRLLLDKYGMDPNEIDQCNKEYHDHEPAVFSLLKYFAREKDANKLNEIKESFNLIVNHRNYVNRNYRIPPICKCFSDHHILPNGLTSKEVLLNNGCSIDDYINSFGWTSFLSDSINVTSQQNSPVKNYPFNTCKQVNLDRSNRYANYTYMESLAMKFPLNCYNEKTNQHYKQDFKVFLKEYDNEVKTVEKLINHLKPYEFCKDKKIIDEQIAIIISVVKDLRKEFFTVYNVLDVIKYHYYNLYGFYNLESVQDLFN
jgi:hypothetical protein